MKSLSNPLSQRELDVSAPDQYSLRHQNSIGAKQGYAGFSRRNLIALTTALACVSTGLARGAEEQPVAKPSEIGDAWSKWWNGAAVLGDMGGFRSYIGRYGVTLGITETSEFLHNSRGGFQTGSAYDGLATVTLKVETEKAFGLEGGTFNVSMLNIHGRNLSQSNLGSLQTASGIEANSGTRLWELWYQQQFGDNADLRLGQQAVDQEFMVSQYAGNLINTMFGWPALPSYDMPGGGPAYPLSALGVRARVHPNDALSVLIGAYNGNPAGTDQGDPQEQNAHGTDFDLHSGALYIGELQYAINQPGRGASANGLPGTYKLGAWYNTQKFDDQGYGSDGLSLADSASNGSPKQRSGDYSLYAVADQMVWRQGKDGPRTLGVFVRVMGAPGDRNLIGLSANVGVTLMAPFEGRDSDTASLGLGYVKVGDHVRDLDRQAGGSVRSSETYVEASYQYQLTPWWQLQPDVQYTFNPGAGQSSEDPTQSLSDTLVWGLRTTLTF
jgi:porin